jgi:hypothetical protein
LSIATSAGESDGCRLLEGVGGIIGGVAGSQVPDLLEPGHFPGHRGLAHSIAVGTLIIRFTKDELPSWQARLREWGNFFGAKRSSCPPESIESVRYALAEAFCWLAGAIAGFLGGYGSHLFLDSFSPYGLRLI